MNATIELDLISIVLLVFAVMLAQRNLQSNPRNRWYILSAFSLLVVLGTELFAYRVDGFGFSWQIAFHRITNVLGFSLSPLVCYFLFLFIGYSQYRRRRPVLLFPFIINAVLSIASYWTGWSFFVDQQNVYRRGPLFFLATLVMFFYYGLCIIYLIKTLRRYEASDRLLLFFIMALPIAGFAVQMFFPKVLTLWPTIALSLLLFYLFFLEQQYSIDTLTLLRNRSIFLRDLLDYQQSRKGSTTVVVLDVNYLKKVNDTQGHKAGDELLVLSGYLIEQCFRGVGTAYRVGGDEFAVISTMDDSKEVGKALDLLNTQLGLANKNRTSPLSLAVGWAWCESSLGNLYNTYVAADNAMYRNKEAMKRKAGNR